MGEPAKLVVAGTGESVRLISQKRVTSLLPSQSAMCTKARSTCCST